MSRNLTNRRGRGKILSDEEERRSPIDRQRKRTTFCLSWRRTWDEETRWSERRTDFYKPAASRAEGKQWAVPNIHFNNFSSRPSSNHLSTTEICLSPLSLSFLSLSQLSLFLQKSLRLRVPYADRTSASLKPQFAGSARRDVTRDIKWSPDPVPLRRSQRSSNQSRSEIQDSTITFPSAHGRSKLHWWTAQCGQGQVKGHHRSSPTRSLQQTTVGNPHRRTSVEETGSSLPPFCCG